MDRNRDGRRASIVGSNGFNRRRHRTNSLRDSPDEDVGLELQESVRLRDRVKKDRDHRERDRERERERERERDLRERSSRSKRRGERLATNRDDVVGDESSEESVNDEEDEEDEETAAAGVGGGGVRLVAAAHHHGGHLSNHHHTHSSSFSQQQQQQQHNSSSNSPSGNLVSSNHHLQHRKNFPPSFSAAAAANKVIRAPPVWKTGDEMIGVSVPRKARSASTKRSHDWISSSSNNNSGGGVSGEQNLGPGTSSPANQVAVAAPSPAAGPVSPSSSNASMKKKLKPGVNNSSGPKLKPPKGSSKPSSSNPEELEIEIAEVLYGLMTQSQAPSSKKEESREITRLNNSDAKSRNSSPISNSTSNNPNLGHNSSPLSAVAPKRKRPRHVPENSSYGHRSSPVSAKPDTDQAPKSEISSPNLEKTSGSVAENGYGARGNSINLQEQPAEPPAPTPPVKPDLALQTVAEELVAKEEVSSPKERESPAARVENSNNGDPPLMATATASSAIKASSEIENQKEEKFEIDLMAPPPQGRASPERESKIDFRDSSSSVDQKPSLSNADRNSKQVLPKIQEDENSKSGTGKDHPLNVEKKGGEEAESHKGIENKSRNVDLRLDFEKSEREIGDGVNATGNSKPQQQQQQQNHKQQQQQIPLTEKNGHSTSSLPLPMSMPGWPGGLPTMGYMAPLQGVVSMEGGSVTPGHIQPVFSQPRPKRCATHCHIARNILCLQQFMKMNPFWPPPAGSSLFGSKSCSLNVVPAADMHGKMGQTASNVPNVPNHGTKDKASQSSNSTPNPDSASQRKQQILIQQAMPPVPPSNLLGPTFIFPLNQQQAGVGPRPSSGAKSSAVGTTSSTAPTSVPSTTQATNAMSFNYPNMPSNETQYLAILQNNGYPFPIPTVGAPQNYRGNPAQAMPIFNGSFYSSQMIHPSQIQHHQSQIQSAQLMQAHQNASASSGSSSSQKHLQGQKSQSGSGVISSGSGNAGMQNFSAQKSQQLSHNQYGQPSRPRHHEGEQGSEDSPSTTDSRGSRAASMNIYGQNFSIPIHPQNFALMTSPAALATAAATATSASSNQNDKKPHQPQQQGMKTGSESLPPHGFAMSFGTINGANNGSGIDITSMTQNHAMFQSSNIQMMAAAQAAQKKNFRVSDDGKSGGVDSSTGDDERKSLSAKALGGGSATGGGGGQSIAFTRQDMADQANSVIESSARSGGVRASRSTPSNTVGAMNVANTHNIQAQIHQQQQIMQLKHQQQQQQLAANAANRSKGPVTSNGPGNMYTEHMNSSSMGAKFPNSLSGFPQNLVQNNTNSPNQSPQWKTSNRAPTPQVLSSSTTTSLKSQHPRSQPQMHTQISFGGNQKPPTNSQAGQAPPTTNQTGPSSPMMVGSPTTSSISKGASGSPRTNSSASTNKLSQSSSFSAQPTKNSPSGPAQKSPSILGTNNGPKNQMQQQQQQLQQQMQKGMQAMQPGQLFFTHTYPQSQPPHSGSTSSTTSGPAGYFMARRRPDQHQQGPGGQVNSTGGLSLCPVTLGSTNTNDPATAIAAATANVKGGGLVSQGMIHASQFAAQSGGTLLPAGFSYLHPIPAGVQVKPAEQKQPAGDDNLHQWQPEKK